MDGYGLYLYELPSWESIHFANLSSPYLVLPSLHYASSTTYICATYITYASSIMPPRHRNTRIGRRSIPYADLRTRAAPMHSHYKANISLDMHVGLSKRSENLDPTFD